VTAPDLTPEQRETLHESVRVSLKLQRKAGAHPGLLTDDIAAVVARLLADADRQGAARVAASVEEACAASEAYMPSAPDAEVFVSEVRAALAEATTAERTAE
jgi:hypothetical protein